MLKSYEAVYENGRVTWLNDRPAVDSARIIVTVLEEMALPQTPKRTFPAGLIGKVEILGDIVSPRADEEDWECLK